MRALYFDGGKLRYVDDHPAPAAGGVDAVAHAAEPGIRKILIDAT